VCVRACGAVSIRRRNDRPTDDGERLLACRLPHATASALPVAVRRSAVVKCCCVRSVGIAYPPGSSAAPLTVKSAAIQVADSRRHEWRTIAFSHSGEEESVCA